MRSDDEIAYCALPVRLAEDGDASCSAVALDASVSLRFFCGLLSAERDELAAGMKMLDGLLIRLRLD